jgi:P27 family predicted phage terminase small subunit
MCARPPKFAHNQMSYTPDPDLIMAQAKRTRTNSVAGTTLMFARLQKTDPRPTQPLDEQELAAYTRIVRSREAGSFSEHDVQLATQLAQMMVLCEDYTTRIKNTGPTIMNANGTPVANPLLSARDSTFRSISQITKMLGLSASQKGMSGAPQAKRNAADRAARETLEKASEDSLI